MEKTDEQELPPKKYGPRPELTPKQKIELNKAFGTFDPRGSGIIHVRGLALAFRAMGYEPKISDLEALITKEIGRESIENLDFKDFYKLMSAQMIGDDSLEDTKKAFKMFSNEEGVITLDNLVEIAKELEENLSRDELREMITFADKTGNGVVTFKEFVKILERPYLE